MESMIVRNGVIQLVFTLMNRNRSIVKCNYLTLRDDNNSFQRDSQAALQIFQSLTIYNIRIIYFVSVRKRLQKVHKESILWKQETLHLVNKNSKNQQNYQCHLMSHKISLYSCKPLIDMEQSSSLQSLVIYICMKFQTQYFSSDKE